MKSLLLTIVCLTFIFAGSLRAQSGSGNPAGGYCPNAGDILSPCHGNGLGNNPWPMSLVVDILRDAKPFYWSELHLSLGQLIQEYHDCRCVIQYLGDNRWRVNISGAVDCCIEVTEGL